MKELKTFYDKQTAMNAAIDNSGKYNRDKPTKNDFKEVQSIFDEFDTGNAKKNAAQYWKTLKKDPYWKRELYLLKEKHFGDSNDDEKKYAAEPEKKYAAEPEKKYAAEPEKKYAAEPEKKYAAEPTVNSIVEITTHQEQEEKDQPPKKPNKWIRNGLFLLNTVDFITDIIYTIKLFEAGEFLTGIAFGVLVCSLIGYLLYLYDAYRKHIKLQQPKGEYNWAKIGKLILEDAFTIMIVTILSDAPLLKDDENGSTDGSAVKTFGFISMIVSCISLGFATGMEFIYNPYKKSKKGCCHKKCCIGSTIFLCILAGLISCVAVTGALL
eukprot:259507_1